MEKARECYHAAMAMDSKHDSSGPPGLPGYAEIVDEDDWESGKYPVIGCMPPQSARKFMPCMVLFASLKHGTRL